MKRIVHVVGARPNFMKVAPVHRALDGLAVQSIVHTGQHYDTAMSAVFFEQLDIAPPTVNLEVGSGSHAVQTAEVMKRFERVMLDCRPDLVMVYGDVNSTMAAALVARKLLVPVAHVEAGLRSGDSTMPEETNRRVTDVLADLLFTPSKDADRNLIGEGIPSERIHFVGNVMIDTLVRLLPRANGQPLLDGLSVSRGSYVLVTLHRPSNVDRPDILSKILTALGWIADRAPVIFPVHPRTRQRLDDTGVPVRKGIHLIEPLGYLDFLGLQKHAAAVVTDSGGVQEETTFLGIPCITLRENTERPITVECGTNVIVGNDWDAFRLHVERALNRQWPSGRVPHLWDGRAGERIAAIVGSS
jgi:UDP-N-acetylglucosamine 2-epimerase (non-hydrolysing)